MNNTNQHLYSIYKNIHSFYEYRNMHAMDPIMEQDKFIKDIQKNKCIIMTSVPNVDKQKLDNAENMKVLVILLVYPGTECENKKANMTKLISKITSAFADVIIITPVKISAGVSKGLKTMNVNTKKAYRSYRSFTYTLFNSVLPEHDLVPKYEILNDEQIDVLKEWNIDPDTLPKIFENDPQMVWAGAQVGDVVKFTYLSENTIEAIGYCKVIQNI